jgi:2-methylcitrate dehydratase
LDYNDSFRGGGHPSDMTPAIICAAEMADATGLEAIRGIFIAYEVFAALSESYAIRDAGWDQGPFVAVATAMGTGAVLGLTQAQLANAVSLALVPNLALHCTRTGELSNWKGCATAHAAMTGLFAARLALLGMTGPAAPFEGVDGFHRQVPPRADVALGHPRAGQSAIEQSTIKRYPAVIHTQGVIEALLSVRHQVKAEEIERLNIDTYAASWFAVGGGGGDKEEKWHPRTRETADHSLPFVAALSLLDGDVTIASFDADRLQDPRLIALMRRTTVRAREDLTALFPDERRSEITIELRNGTSIKVSTTFALGTPQNPMTDSQLADKFGTLVKPVLGARDCADLMAALWRLPQIPRVDELTQHFRRITVKPFAAGPSRH